MSDDLTPALPSIAAVAARIGVPADRWAGRCYEIACAIAAAPGLLPYPEALAVYGHYRGPVAPSCAMFHDQRERLGFVRHGWLWASPAREVVLDPTRWVFDAAAPYLYRADDARADYDEGGNALLRAQLRPPPPADHHARTVALQGLGPATYARVLHLLGEPMTAGRDRAARFGEALVLDLGRLLWLANLPLCTGREAPSDLLLAPAQSADLYAAIVAAGEGCFLPLDNRRRVLGRENPPPR